MVPKMTKLRALGSRIAFAIGCLCALCEPGQAATYETGVQPQTWNVYDPAWTPYKEFKVVVGGVDVAGPYTIEVTSAGDQFYDVPNYQQEGPFTWQIQSRHYNGPALGNYWTSWGVVDSGTATEVSSYEQYDAWVNIENTTGHQAVYTLTWWKTADPDNPAFQHSSQVTLDPTDKWNIHLRELYPFSYRVTRQDPTIEIDGTGFVPDPEVEEEGDSEVTEVETEPEETIHDINTPNVPNPTPDEDTERPHETADTTAKLDKNQDARSQDARNDALMQAKASTGTTAAVNAMSKSLGAKIGDVSGGGTVSEDVADRGAETEAKMGAGTDAAGIWGQVEAIGAELSDLADNWQMSASTAAWPTLGWEWPEKIGGGGFYFDLDEYSSWIEILRIGLLGLCGWEFVVLCVAAIKGISS